MSRRDDMNAKAARVEAKYGKTLGASKGKPAPTKWKVKPTGGLKNPGIKATKKF